MYIYIYIYLHDNKLNIRPSSIIDRLKQSRGTRQLLGHGHAKIVDGGLGKAVPICDSRLVVLILASVFLVSDDDCMRTSCSNVM